MKGFPRVVTDPQQAKRVTFIQVVSDRCSTYLSNWMSKNQIYFYLRVNFALHKKMKFCIKNFFSKCDQIRTKLWIWSHLLMKSLMKNCIICAVLQQLLQVLIWHKKLAMWCQSNVLPFSSQIKYEWKYKVRLRKKLERDHSNLL